jgi:hypothetical protein
MIPIILLGLSGLSVACIALLVLMPDPDEERDRHERYTRSRDELLHRRYKLDRAPKDLDGRRYDPKTGRRA